MKKSISDLTASTGFSLVGSSMVGSGVSSGSINGKGRWNGGSAGRGMKRAWDWRDGLNGDEKPGRLLKRLRLGLAKEVAGSWIE